MKKTLAIVLSLVLALALFSGCGNSYSSVSSSAAKEDGAGMAAYDYAYEEFAYEYEMEAPAAPEEAYWANTQNLSSSPSETVPPDMNGVKMIYTARMEMDATEFDTAVSAIADLTSECGGYYESSSMNDRGGSRSASFTVRVPADKYRTFLDKAGTVSHVTYQEEAAEDVSETYYDTAGRLETQKTKLGRLQELLAEANHMDDIITIENEISETEEYIDRLSGTLRHYDALVSYSTVSITLREVKIYTEVPQVQETFGQRLGSAFRSGLRSFGDALADIMVALAYSWIWLVIIAAIVVVILLATKKKRQANKEMRERMRSNPPASPAYSRPELKQTQPAKDADKTDGIE